MILKILTFFNTKATFICFQVPIHTWLKCSWIANLSMMESPPVILTITTRTKIMDVKSKENISPDIIFCSDICIHTFHSYISTVNKEMMNSVKVTSIFYSYLMHWFLLLTGPALVDDDYWYWHHTIMGIYLPFYPFPSSIPASVMLQPASSLIYWAGGLKHWAQWAECLYQYFLSWDEKKLYIHFKYDFKDLTSTRDISFLC